MASSLDITAELQLYFRDNWTETPLKLPDFPFDDTGIDKWIAISYAPIINSIIGCNGTTTGRLNYNGLFSVYCYSELRMNTYDLADKVTAFLAGVVLPLNIRVGIAQHGQVHDLDTDLFELQVTFEIDQD